MYWRTDLKNGLPSLFARTTHASPSSTNGCRWLFVCDLRHLLDVEASLVGSFQELWRRRTGNSRPRLTLSTSFLDVSHIDRFTYQRWRRSTMDPADAHPRTWRLLCTAMERGVGLVFIFLFRRRFVRCWVAAVGEIRGLDWMGLDPIPRHPKQSVLWEGRMERGSQKRWNHPWMAGKGSLPPHPRWTKPKETTVAGGIPTTKRTITSLRRVRRRSNAIAFEWNEPSRWWNTRQKHRR